MAKQNVTFIERHAEKFALGVAGAILLGTIALYGISSPNRVEIGGEQVGPKEFYARLKEQAESARNRMRSKSVSPPELPLLADKRGGRSNVPLDGMWGVVPPHPAVPMTEGDGGMGERVLAEILPPQALTVLTGRGHAPLPPQQVIEVGAGAVAPPNSVAIPRDYHWALLVAAVDRKAQKAEFAKARYDEVWQQLIVARVDVERRQLEPDGTWSEPVLVRGYSERFLTGRTEIRPEMVENQLVFAETEHAYVKQYRAQLYSAAAQDEILRPAFQPFLEKPLAWQPPQTLPGFEFKLAEYGIAFPVEGGGRPKPGNRPNAPQGGGAPGGFDPEARKRARELQDQADKAFQKGDLLKAAELLEQIVADNSLPEKERKTAEELLTKHQAEILVARTRLEDQQKRDQALGIVKLGEDQEPLWVTDITVEPGRTYQYRIRLAAFNELAGKLSLLKDPKDAERVIIDGKWSDWSEPVTIYPAVHVFFVGASDGSKARLTVSQWIRGEWRDGSSDLEVGQPLMFTKGRDTFKYDGTGSPGDGPAAIIAGIENGRQFRPRGRTVLEAPVRTDVLTLVNVAGQIEERVAEEDKYLLRDHRDRVSQEKRLLASELAQPISTPARAGLNAPAPVPLGGMDGPPMRGRGGGFDGGGRRGGRRGLEEMPP